MSKMKKFLFALCLLFVTSKVNAATINAASCAYADVNTAVVAAANGDTVNVPAGTCTWSTKLTPTNKYITLQGAGVGSTVLIQGSRDIPLIVWSTVAGGLTRLTGFTLQGNPTAGANSGSVVTLAGVSPTARIDHNKFILTESSGITSIFILNYVRGVADHNTFDISSLGFCCGYYVHHDTWSTPGTNFGDVSWASADTWGTDQAWYWETNTIIYNNTGHPSGSRHGATTDGWMGSRVVNRFNTYTNTLLSGGHGTDSSQRWRGRRQTETYNETLLFDCLNCGGGDTISPALAGRGGPMMMFNNTITAQNGATVATAIQIAIDRFTRVDTSYQPWTYCGQTSVVALTPAGVMTTSVPHGIGVATYGGAPTKVQITGATGGDAALYNGIHNVAAITSSTQATLTLAGTPTANATGTVVLTSPFDGNTTPFGYPCLDQAGYGQSDLLTGTNPSPVAWPHQVLTPSLYWNNKLNGVLQAPTSAPNVVVLNREYRTDSTITQGVIGSRPSTCTTGVLYWATDEGNWNTTVPTNTSGKLYKCISTNTWTAWYGNNNSTGQPLTYPHPLVGAPVPPPPPVPIGVSYSPSSATVLDNIASGTLLTTFSVTMSDGSAFTGTTSLTANPGSIATIVGSTLKTARTLSGADDGNKTFTVQATQNSTSASGNFSLTINASPVPTVVTLSPSPATLQENAVSGAFVSNITVTTSDGSQFTGSLALTANPGSTVALSGNSVVLARNLTHSDIGTLGPFTVQATENGVSVSSNVSITVSAIAPPPSVPIGISFTPTSLSIFDNTASGTSLTTFVVAMNDGSTFTGSTSLTANPGSIAAISGSTLQTARTLSGMDDGIKTITLQATENATSVSQNFMLTIVATPPPPPPSTPTAVIFTPSTPKLTRHNKNLDFVTNIGVVMNDTSTFTGTLTLTANPGNTVMIVGNTLVLARDLSSLDVGTLGPFTVQATENSVSASANVSITVTGGHPNKPTNLVVH